MVEVILWNTNKTTLYVQVNWDQTLTSTDKSDPWWNAFSSACEQMYVLGVDHCFLTLCYGFRIKSECHLYVLLFVDVRTPLWSKPYFKNCYRSVLNLQPGLWVHHIHDNADASSFLIKIFSGCTFKIYYLRLYYFINCIFFCCLLLLNKCVSQCM